LNSPVTWESEDNVLKIPSDEIFLLIGKSLAHHYLVLLAAATDEQGGESKCLEVL
jgi:hypothetical protein